MAGVLPISDLQEGKKHDIWKIGDALVLFAYSCVVLWTIRYHEKWADEAQAWLIARDLNLRTIWFHELRYEGSPGLWHTILWIAQHVFHAGYGALGYIGAFFAIAGAAVLLFFAPFPRYIRWPLAFTYVMVYQYAVIARPYTLLPLLVFAAAILFKDMLHPERITVVLALLALLTLHGAIFAGCLGLAYLLQALRVWASLQASVRRRYLVCIASLGLIFVFIALVLKPTPDVAEFALKEKMKETPGLLALQPTPLRKAEAVVSGAFLDYTVPSATFIVLAAAWCFHRKRLLEFALPVSLLIGLYSFVHGYPHHHGTVYMAAIAAFWIAWPTFSDPQHSVKETWIHRGAVTLMLCLCAVNITDAAVAIRREFLYPYSGGKDAATYLKKVGADKRPMFGFLYGMTSVQAYFDHNLLANTHTAYYHNGLPEEGTELNLSDLHRINPEYVVAYSNDPELMVQTSMPLLVEQGYELVHFSDGYYLYKRAVYQRETYFIFRRKVSAANWHASSGTVDESPLLNGHP